MDIREEVWAQKTSLTLLLFIEVPVRSQESEQSCIYVLEVSILSLSTIPIFDFRTVLTVWYFRTVLTVWYFRTVLTVWYFRTVLTVWYFRTVLTVWYFRTVLTVWYFVFGFHFITRKYLCDYVPAIVMPTPASWNKFHF